MAAQRNNEKHKVIRPPRRQEPPLVPSPGMRHQLAPAILLWDVVPFSNPKTESKSSPISFPKSHIHRTPSEADLSDETRRAEHRDDVMYSRLVIGMLTQMKRSASENGGDAALRLSIKSLEGIIKTKRSNWELELYDTDFCDWKMPLSDGKDEEYSASYCPDEALSWSLSSTQTFEEAFSMLLPPAERSGPENDCVFCLEL